MKTPLWETIGEVITELVDFGERYYVDCSRMSYGTGNSCTACINRTETCSYCIPRWRHYNAPLNALVYIQILNAQYPDFKCAIALKFNKTGPGRSVPPSLPIMESIN